MPIENQINRETTGLLDLFRATQGGRNPQKIIDSVQPTVDVAGYLTARMNRFAVNSSVGTPPADFTITVPETEAWLVSHVSLRAYTYLGAIAVAQSMWCQLDLNISGVVGTLLGFLATNETVSTQVAGREEHLSPGSPLVVPPGAIFTGNNVVNDVTSDNWLLGASILYAPLRI